MQSYLSDETIELLGGIKNKYDVRYDPYELWDELEQGNTNSNIIGVALTKVAVKCVNNHFRLKKEHHLNQPEIVSYISEKLFEKIVVKNALLDAFPEKPRETRIVAYIYTAACNYKNNLVEKLLDREAIAPEDSLDNMYDTAANNGSTIDAVEVKIGQRNSGIIQEARKEENREEDHLDRIIKRKKKEEKEKKERKKRDYPQITRGNDPLLHEPYKRAMLNERIEEAINKADVSKVRTRELVEEVIGRMEDRRIMLEYQKSYLGFNNSGSMLTAIEDIEEFNQYTFYYIDKDVHLENKYFKHDDRGLIKEINDHLEKVKEVVGEEGILFGISMIDIPDFDLDDYEYELDFDIDRLPPPDVMDVVITALMFQDFWKAYYQRLEVES